MREHNHGGLIVGRRGDGRIMLIQPCTDDDATIGDMIVIHRANVREVISELAKHLDGCKVVFVRR